MRALYGSVNTAQAETYRVAGLLNPAAQLGEIEPCLRTDNAVGKMPSVLANPTFPQPSIAQRAALFRVLVAYFGTAAVLLENAPASGVRTAFAHLRTSVTDLRANAKIHLQNDLVISDLSSRVGNIAAQLSAARANRRSVAAIVIDAEPTIGKLIAILERDATAAHDAALIAAGDAYTAWTAYADGARTATPAGTQAPGPSPIARCAAPFSAQAKAFVAAAGVAGAGINRKRRVGADPRLNVARLRYRTLKDTDPSNMLASLRKIDDALERAARSPADRAALADLSRSIVGFQSDVRSLYAAYQGAKIQ